MSALSKTILATPAVRTRIDIMRELGREMDVIDYEVEQIMNDMNEVKTQRDFRYQEVSCPCGKCATPIDRKFIDRIQCLRDSMDIPFRVNSWHRCKEYNKSVGGTPNSQHINGRAVDISTIGWSSEQRYQLLRMAFNFGFTGISQAKHFIHIDLRQDKVSTWTY